jgi:hypothetical protein
MEAKTAAIFGIVLAIVIGAVVALGTIPTSAYSGGGSPTIVCTANLTVSGTYEDLLVSHSISGFALTGGGIGCHPQTLLDLVPSSSFNIFPFGLTFSVTLTALGGTTHGPYKIVVNVPAGGAAPSYPFNVGTQVANVPQGQYSATVTCPVACTSSSGNQYTTTINI